MITKKIGINKSWMKEKNNLLAVYSKGLDFDCKGLDFNCKGLAFDSKGLDFDH